MQERCEAFIRLFASFDPLQVMRRGYAVIRDENVFAKLMEAARVCSLGQITDALFEVGGQYRRSM